MSRDEKLDILRQVMSSKLPAQKALAILEIPKSTYYRWCGHWRRMSLQGVGEEIEAAGQADHKSGTS